MQNKLGCVLLLFFSQVLWAAPIPLTILHTNDLHSHYKASKDTLGLGGVARLATAISREKAASTNVLTLDGGDWSEGNIYYKLDAGRTAIEIMNQMGYDATVMGNHDWLNGPDYLLNLLEQNRPRFSILAQNIDSTKYDNAATLEKFVQPYQIFTVGGLKVGVIGVVTYELIYDHYLSPIAITDPFGSTKRLALKLKNEDEVDVVVVISHNGFDTNKMIAGFAGIDVVIHAHDHEKFFQPVVVEKKGKTSYLVEAQMWGYYLGKLDLAYDRETKKLELKKYDLIQIDSSIPEDPIVAGLVENYDHQLQSKYGDILTTPVAQSSIEVRKEFAESTMGNLVTDAYRSATGADLAFEQTSLTSEDLYQGGITSADIFNIIPAIFNPFTQKSWTIKTMEMSGETLSKLVNFVLNVGKSSPGWMPSVSGAKAVFDPTKVVLVTLDAAKRHMYQAFTALPPQQQPPGDSSMLVSLEIGGNPIQSQKLYKVATSEGLNQALDFIEQFFSLKFERLNYQDTGIEEWRALEKYLVQNSPLTSDKISRGNRFVALKSDLTLYSDEISFVRNQNKISGQLSVRNLGAASSMPTVVHFGYDKTPLYHGDNPNIMTLEGDRVVPALGANQKSTVNFEINLPMEFSKTKVPLYFWLEHIEEDSNPKNENTWVMAPAEGSVSGFEKHTSVHAHLD